MENKQALLYEQNANRGCLLAPLVGSKRDPFSGNEG